jgi:methylglutaconyl-CoA hydratase
MLIDYSVSGAIARITLNRPEKRNAFNPELIRALCDALDRAAADQTVRVILLRGAGRDFCGGMDLVELARETGADAMGHLAGARIIAGLFRSLRRNPRPIVAAVHGRAIAGGCGLATACDLILATESAEFRYNEVNIGFVAAIVTAMLRRSVGEKHAFELLAGGGAISAREAHRIGMVNHVFPDAEFDRAVEEYVAELAAKSASAVSLTKNLLYHIDGMSFESALQAGEWVNALARNTADAQRGFDRFVHKKD